MDANSNPITKSCFQSGKFESRLLFQGNVPIVLYMVVHCLVRKLVEYLALPLLWVLIFSLSFSKLAYSNIPGFEDGNVPASQSEWNLLEQQIQIQPLKYQEELQQLLNNAVKTQNIYATLRLKLKLVEMEIIKGDEVKAAKLLEELKSPINKTKNIELEALFLLQSLELRSRTINKEETDKILKRISKLVDVIDSDRLRFNYYLTVGRHYRREEFYYLALDFFIDALENARKRNYYYDVATALNDSANTLINLKDYKTAQSYYKQSIDLIDKENEQYNYSVLLYSLSITQLELGDLELATGSLKEAKRISKNIGDNIGILFADYKLGDIAMRNQQYNEAVDIFRDISQQFKLLGNLNMETSSLIGLAKGLNRTQQYNRALQSIAKISTSLHEKQKKEIHLIKADAYAGLGQLKMAIRYYRAHSEAVESMQDKQQKSDLIKVRVQLEDRSNWIKAKLLENEVELQKSEIRNANNRRNILILITIIIGLITFFAFVSLKRQIRKRQRMTELAMTDPLTRAPNRRSILKYLDFHIDQAKELYVPLAVGILDIDHFKKVNDSFGHDTGDQVLIAFAKAIEQGTRSQDYFGRYGGEEWLMVLPQQTNEGIEAMFKRIKSSIDEQSIEGLPEDYKIEFSAGFAFYELGESKEELVSRADTSLYFSKESGRNRFNIHGLRH